MNVDAAYRDHLATIQSSTEASLEHARGRGESFEGIVFHAGTRFYYHADDRDIPFHTVPHYARFVPVSGPDHVVLFRPGQPLRLFRKIDRDYWYEPPVQPDHPFASVISVRVESLRMTAGPHQVSVVRL